MIMSESSGGACRRPVGETEHDAKDRATLKRLKKQAYAARNFPTNTDPCSRHVYLMAEGLAGKGYPMLQEEPLHCAISLMATAGGLWGARTDLAAFRCDAERYQWLRECVRTKAGRVKAQALFWHFESRKQFDAAIDAEIALAAAPLSHVSEPSDKEQST